eukprot:13422903-Alexandrium_andersonii.AAC.1
MFEPGCRQRSLVPPSRSLRPPIGLIDGPSRLVGYAVSFVAHGVAAWRFLALARLSRQVVASCRWAARSRLSA